MNQLPVIVTSGLPAFQIGLRAKRILKPLSGGARSILVECNDGHRYVLKPNHNPQGPNVLANEFLGTCLLRGLGIHTPQAAMIMARPIDLGLDSVDEEWHFGTAFLGEPSTYLLSSMSALRMPMISNRQDVYDVALFDLWANHQDRRQFLYRRTQGKALYEAIAIDNGHLFGGPDWSRLVSARGSEIWREQTGGYVDDYTLARVKHLQKVLPPLLRDAATELPLEWYDGNFKTLLEVLAYRLEQLGHMVLEAY